ncbi:hypothetical protein DOE78_15075 [Bacillus sp. Y1]|nr:hypothetical protein DOE78_15075 [Bacillus sp. Y1]
MKSSTFYRNFRELMVGANQCGSIREWTSEPPNRTFIVVGLGESLIVTRDRYLLLLGKQRYL